MFRVKKCQRLRTGNTVLHTHNPRPHHHHVINFLQKGDLEMSVLNDPVTENPYDEVPLYEELV